VPSDFARISKPIKLGDDFELDPQAYELRRAGRSLRLERIPMELLLLLVEQRGALVSRELIVERIWGSGVFLDTDNSINGAIRKIRQALKDDPDDPHFVQTVPGKGYRFIASAVRSEVEPPAPASAAVTSEPPALVETKPLRRPGAVISAIAVVLIGALATYAYWSRLRSTPQTPERLMLAVLPFENLTGDPAQDYFSDGMTEEMITQLGRINPDRVGVIARTSVMNYKASRQPMDQISRELGAQYLLEGSVRRDGDRVRITAQLIQAKDKTTIWAQQYDREIKDLLALQSDIAQKISQEIQSALGDHEKHAAAQTSSPRPVESEVYDLYLKGLYCWNKRTSEGLEQAIKYFQAATVKDPSYARAWAGLADSYALLGGYTGVSASDYMSQARSAAQRALELDNSLPEAHTALALVVQNYDYDWQTSETEFKRAIELDPNYATAHHWYAEHLMWQGRFEEALRESERARLLDPLSLIIAADNGVILLYARQYDRAITKFRSVLELDPGFSRAQMLRHAYIEKGMFPEAMAQTAPFKGAPWYWAEMAAINGRDGHKLEAQRALKRLLDLRARQRVDPMIMAYAYVSMGNKPESISYLEEAYTWRSSDLICIKVDPAYDSLRDDPRFRALLGRMGLSG